MVAALLRSSRSLLPFFLFFGRKICPVRHTNSRRGERRQSWKVQGTVKRTYRRARRTNRRTRSSIGKCSTLYAVQAMPVEERPVKKAKSVRTTKDTSVRETKK